MKISCYITEFLVISIASKICAKNSRVFGGRLAHQFEFPYMVALFKENPQGGYNSTEDVKCGGAIIDKITVLTAAHCIFRGKYSYLRYDLTVAAGCTIISPFDSETQFRSKTVGFVYRAYVSSANLHDIAVLKVEEPFTLDRRSASAIKLRTTDVAEGTLCHAHGWGYFGSEEERTSKQLRTADLHITSFEECKRMYLTEGVVIEDSHICAGSPARDVCWGDSGGPLVCDNLLTGIVAFGQDCRTFTLPGVYTKVMYYIDFIRNPENYTIKNNACSCLSQSSLQFYIFILWTIFYSCN